MPPPDAQIRNINRRLRSLQGKTEQTQKVCTSEWQATHSSSRRNMSAVRLPLPGVCFPLESDFMSSDVCALARMHSFLRIYPFHVHPFTFSKVCALVCKDVFAPTVLKLLESKRKEVKPTRDSSSSSISTSITSTHASQPGFSKGASEGGAAQDVSAQLAMLRAAKATCVLAIVQDTADALIAINDIRGEMERCELVFVHARARVLCCRREGRLSEAPSHSRGGGPGFWVHQLP
eukprot:1161089-Pelagomonas_calceolata.AAC.4